MLTFHTSRLSVTAARTHALRGPVPVCKMSRRFYSKALVAVSDADVSCLSVWVRVTVETSAAATFLIPFDLFLSTPAYFHLLSTLTCPICPAPPYPAPGMASILMSAVGLGVHFTTAPLPQQQQPQQQPQQQQPAPFSLPPPLLPPASRSCKPPSSSSSSSVRRAKRQHRRGSYHATSPPSTFICPHSLVLWLSLSQALGTCHPASTHFHLSLCHYGMG